jgi:hypothetical protein
MNKESSKRIKLKSILKEPFLAEKSVLSYSLPKTDNASHKKPLVFIKVKGGVFEGVETLFQKSFHEQRKW